MYIQVHVEAQALDTVYYIPYILRSGINELVCRGGSRIFEGGGPS